MCHDCLSKEVSAAEFIKNNCLGFSFISACIAIGLSEVDIRRLSNDQAIAEQKIEQLADYCEWTAEQTGEFKRLLSD